MVAALLRWVVHRGGEVPDENPNYSFFAKRSLKKCQAESNNLSICAVSSALPENRAASATKLLRRSSDKKGLNLRN